MCDDSKVIVNRLRDEARVHLYELSLVLAQVKNNVEGYDEEAFGAMEKSYDNALLKFNDFFDSCLK